MKITYLGRLSEIDVAGHGSVKRGKDIDLPKEVAESLIKANPEDWSKGQKAEKGAK